MLSLILALYGIEAVTTWDPAELTTTSQMRESATVYESVLGYEASKTLEAESSRRLVPVLLSRMPQSLDGGRRWRLTVKPGVRWDSDPRCLPQGRELVAEDLAYSWKRLVNPKANWPARWILGDLLQDVRVRGTRELEVTLSAPKATFLYRLASPLAAIVARECVEAYGEDFRRNPVGTGPFRLVRAKSDPRARLQYEARADYHVPGLPRSPRLAVKVVTEPHPRWLGFLAGEVPLLGVSKEAVPEAKADRRLLLLPEDLPNTIRLSFNLDSPKLSGSLALRRSISQALSRESYVAMFLQGQGLPAQGPIAPGVEGYAPVAPSRQQTSSSGDFRGLTLTFNAVSNTNTRQFGEWLSQQLSGLGIKLEVASFMPSEWRARINKREGDLWLERWDADYPDADNFLQLYDSRHRSPGVNDSGYSNPEFDALLDQIDKSTGAGRRRLIARAESILRRDVPAVWLAHERMLRAYRTVGDDPKRGPRLTARYHPFDYMVRKYMALKQP